MRFKALSVSANGNLVLSSAERKAVERKLPLFCGGKRVGEVFDTIGSVGAPLYLARVGGPEKYVGKNLEGK